MLRSFLIFTLFSLLIACRSPQFDTDNLSNSFGPRDFGEPTMTALVVAYEPELNGVLGVIDQLPDAELSQTMRFKGVTYRVGQYKGEPIVVFATGMSIANAAMTMQMAFDYFPIDKVLYMGIAGAINPALKPGDVVVPERWYYHDESVYINAGEDEGEYVLPNYYREFLEAQPARRAKDPHLPEYDNFGYIHPDEVLVIKEGMDKPQDTAYFSASPELLSAARSAISDMPAVAVSDERNARIFVGGNGVTGSVFLDNRNYRQWVQRVFKAEVTEMESAAIGQVSYINDVDWMIIRAVSDLAGGQEGVNHEDTYADAVSVVGAKVLFEVLDELAQD